jgi:hypothetical protein
MTIRLSIPKVLLASTAVFAISSSTWSADHRDAPSISDLSDRVVMRCDTLLALPMKVTVNVPAAVLRRANISVDHYTRNSDGTVDASNYFIWNKPIGTSMTTIVNPADTPGSSQVNEGYITLPSLADRPYKVEFQFASMTTGDSCSLATRVDYGRSNAVVVYWSSGAVRGID